MYGVSHRDFQKKDIAGKPHGAGCIGVHIIKYILTSLFYKAYT